MKKQELVSALAEASGRSKAACVEMLDALGQVGAGALGAGRSVTLPGLGKLTLKQRAARSIQTPQGVALDVPARTSVKFRPAKALKDMLEGEE